MVTDISIMLLQCLVWFGLVFVLSGVQRETDGIQKTDGRRFHTITHIHIYIYHNHQSNISAIKCLVIYQDYLESVLVDVEEI
jgi:hypothetical protein